MPAIALETLAISPHTEQFIIVALRAADTLTLSLVGDPNYYRQFGSSNVPGLVLEGVSPEVFMALSFDGHMPQGTVVFYEAFAATGEGAG